MICKVIQDTYSEICEILKNDFVILARWVWKDQEEGKLQLEMK